QVLGEARLLAHEGPLHAGGESGSAAAAQVGLHHLVHDLLRLHLQRLGQRLVSASRAVGVEGPALRLVPILGEEPGAAHRFGSVVPASARVARAGSPKVPVACGSLCLSRCACGSGRRGSGPFAIGLPGFSRSFAINCRSDGSVTFSTKVKLFTSTAGAYPHAARQAASSSEKWPSAVVSPGWIPRISEHCWITFSAPIAQQEIELQTPMWCRPTGR